MGGCGSKAADQDDTTLTAGTSDAALPSVGKVDSSKDKIEKDKAASKRSSKSKRFSKGTKRVCKTFVAGPKTETGCATCCNAYEQHESCSHFDRGVPPPATCPARFPRWRRRSELASLANLACLTAATVDSDEQQDKGCKQCGLRWPEHTACAKFAHSEARDDACETCGVPASGHKVHRSPPPLTPVPALTFLRCHQYPVNPPLAPSPFAPKACDTFEKCALEGGRCDGCGRARDDHVACLNYRVNLQADTFGDCQCSFGKSEHIEAAFHAAKAVSSARSLISA